MERILKNLTPESVFSHFEDLTRIPRGSGNEKEVSDFLVKFAKKLGLNVIQEECLNIIINKPATKGYENAPRVILQGHMDIVCAKREDLEFDFEKDPIPLVLENDIIKTKGTTLGADNGIAIAMIMAILESNEIPHPPLTALFTVSEETGMDGVIKLNPDNISGDILINIDSEEEGIALSSCAGGVNNLIHLPIDWEFPNASKSAYKISIRGLLGGHSGMEIDKNRGNAIKLLGRILDSINREFNIDIANISGGEKMNAIAKIADAIILIDAENKEKLENIITNYNKVFSNEFKTADPDIKVFLDKVEKPNKVFSKKTKKSLISILRLIPNGVQTMSADIKGLVESSNNIGVLTTSENKISFSSSVRSSIKTLKIEINNRIQNICDLTGANMELIADYPEWEYKVNSPIRDLMQDVYRDMYGKELKVDAIHAGLECGLLKEKVGDIDMISIGPNLYDAHTPNEHLSVSSTKRVFDFLCKVLKRIK
ncbi:aminoacyl-histidine dipeptidase [Paramaledivibacter caminithermalis]|jgi:dipeptidase D|uniref:Cytosol non-specific dipeptidase n=1 Tax=Paramaledivibacter caminithermalis (strain DSM 15212 / CIP 107654 / DViRD3) TaxID=1121301 RepID=A0A1M6TA29_PARC5|nr:aminoacyl-histidine dipeptidase [Paramaledivibacter caminithermalis]SHK53699.1 dipeptidase D [Paramaledivibacter caminithermalis DSM 15212]